MRLWDLRSSVCQRSYDCHSPVNTVALSPNQSDLISGDNSGTVKIWDLEASTCRDDFTPSPEVAIRSLSVSYDASVIALGNSQGKVFVYNSEMESDKIQFVKEFQAHDDYILKCVISPDMASMATTSADKTVKLWNTVTWELDKTLAQHQRWVWDAGLLP